MEYVAKKLSMTEVQVIEVQNKTPESMYCTIGRPKFLDFFEPLFFVFYLINET